MDSPNRSFDEREEIALGRAGGESIRFISRRLGRSPSTISREFARNSDARGAYRATVAHPLAYERASRPKPANLVTNVALRVRVELDLEKKYSPEQIAGRLRGCLLYTSPSPRDRTRSRMPSSA